MLKHVLAYCALAGGAVVLGFFNKGFVKGKWHVDKVERCADHEKYPYNVDLHSKVVNETHSAFYGIIELMENVTEDDYGLCKKTAFGCELMATFEDESLCRFLAKSAEDNFKKVLRNIGVEEHCPVKQGQLQLTDYVYDNKELFDQGLVGAYMAQAFMTKQNPETMKYMEIACTALHVHFDAEDDSKDNYR